MAVKRGDVVTGSLDVNDKKIPLPPGNWTVLGTRALGQGAATPGIATVLVNPKSNPFAVRVITNTSPGQGWGWKLSRSCLRQDLLFQKVIAKVDGGDQRCWWVNHTRMTRGSRTAPDIVQALEYARKRNMKLPVTALLVGYRFADIYDILIVRYYFNPEGEGFNPPNDATWVTNDWHKDRIATDPKKIAYAERIRKWGEGWFPRIQSGFNNEAGAGAPK